MGETLDEFGFSLGLGFDSRRSLVWGEVAGGFVVFGVFRVSWTVIWLHCENFLEDGLICSDGTRVKVHGGAGLQWWGATLRVILLGFVEAEGFCGRVGPRAEIRDVL